MEQDCPHCNVSDETIQKLKDSGENNKKAEYESKKQMQDEKRASGARNGKIKKIVFWVVALLAVGGLVFAGISFLPKERGGAVKATVYYSPTCSCCKGYITYLRANGFEVEAKQTNDMLSVKEKYGIPSEVEACHTTIVGDYFVEGHMPVEFITKVIDEKPNIDGIALPGMPQGSPGMPGIKSGTSTVYGVKSGAPSDFAEW